MSAIYTQRAGHPGYGRRGAGAECWHGRGRGGTAKSLPMLRSIAARAQHSPSPHSAGSEQHADRFIPGADKGAQSGRADSRTATSGTKAH